MRFLKSLLVGIVAAVIGAALWVFVVFYVPIFLPLLVSRFTGSGGASGASVSSDSILAVAFVGFLLGFAWMFRRTARVR